MNLVKSKNNVFFRILHLQTPVFLMRADDEKKKIKRKH